MRLALFALAILGATSISLAADFDGKTEFIHFDKEGTFRVTCFEGGKSQFKTHQCSIYGLKPSMRAHFNHEYDGDASKVVLSRKLDNGKIRRKSSPWDSDENQSERTINLWISTIFQVPLLKMGKNQIDFKLLDSDDETVDAGSFEVVVKDEGTYKCDSMSHTTTDKGLCDSYAQGCQYYFDRQKSCKLQ